MALTDEVRPNLGVNPAKGNNRLRGSHGSGAIGTARTIVRGRTAGSLVPNRPSTASLAGPQPDVWAAYQPVAPAQPPTAPLPGWNPTGTPPLPTNRGAQGDWAQIAAQILASLRSPGGSPGVTKRGW